LQRFCPPPLIKNRISIIFITYLPVILLLRVRVVKGIAVIIREGPVEKMKRKTREAIITNFPRRLYIKKIS
jgi:hypothetical protein